MFDPYFDQENPVETVEKMLIGYDRSQYHEMDAHAFFLTDKGNLLYVHVQGCSCWPDKGNTDQQIITNWQHLNNILRNLPELRDRLQEQIRLYKVSVSAR